MSPNPVERIEGSTQSILGYLAASALLQKGEPVAYAQLISSCTSGFINHSGSVATCVLSKYTDSKDGNDADDSGSAVSSELLATANVLSAAGSSSRFDGSSSISLNMTESRASGIVPIDLGSACNLLRSMSRNWTGAHTSPTSSGSSVMLVPMI